MEEFENGSLVVTNEWERRRLIEQGRRAVLNNDFQGLKDAVRALIGLLPNEERPKIPAGFAGITK